MMRPSEMEAYQMSESASITTSAALLCGKEVFKRAAIAAIARRRDGPRFVNCKWMEQQVAADVMFMRGEAEEAEQ